MKLITVPKNKLKEAPFNINIKEYEGKEKDLEGLTIYSYNQIKSDFNSPIVRECRGVILEGNKVVCRAFDKFGNYGESYVPNIDWSSAKVLEKLDGSLIKVWFYKGKWRVSTNNSINAFETPTNSIFYKTFGELFTQAFNLSIMDNEDTAYTYMFELCSPYNRVVVPFDEITVFYLGRRENETGYEEIFDNRFNLPTPKVYNVSKLEDIIAMSKELNWNEEGYVVVDNNFNRCKIKSPAYVKVHHLADNGNVSLKRLFSLVKENETEELLNYFPEYKDYVDVIKDVIAQVKKNISNKIEKIKSMNFEKRKDFALYIKKDKFSAIYFVWYSNKDLTVDELFNKIKDELIVKILEKRMNK
jgi:T4 RnlA family RNA ligase